jgi:short-subunit dehydrogenase
VLLTGASGGIGQAIARAIAARGGKLILSGRRAEVLEPLAEQLNGRALAVDLTQAEEVDRLCEQSGDVDILIANAALPGVGMLDSFTIEEIDRALAVNLRAPIALAHALAPKMVARGRGQLLFMSSLNAKAATPQTAIYNATKFGLRGFALSLRDDLRASGVGVSLIHPGFIRDAGMFASSGAKLPPGVGTRAPEDVARATIAAIEHDRGEVDVAPLGVRLGSIFAGVAPETAAIISRRLGSDKIAAHIASVNSAKR